MLDLETVTFGHWAVPAFGFDGVLPFHRARVLHGLGWVRRDQIPHIGPTVVYVRADRAAEPRKAVAEEAYRWRDSWILSKTDVLA